jgi:uptake hydrogenase small subunit
MRTVYWLQCGACGGDTMSLLAMEAPDMVELFKEQKLQMLWHPSFSSESGQEQDKIIDSLRSGRRPLDILLVEGFIAKGPNGTGMFDTYKGEPKSSLVKDLAHQAAVTVAVGTCASFGGIGNSGETDACGLQFTKNEPGGLLGENFRSQRDRPVINLPGCPVHPAILKDVLCIIGDGGMPTLNENQCPEDWYSMLIHQGCTRNEYHEYRVEEEDFGGRGCMFFHLGCRGPMTYGPCNKTLWNQRNSKTNAGVPCFGCTQPDFPRDHAFFHTPNIVNVPLELPKGVSRAHYLAYKGMAAAAAPERLTKRKNRV